MANDIGVGTHVDDLNLDWNLWTILFFEMNTYSHSGLVGSMPVGIGAYVWAFGFPIHRILWNEC